MSKSVFPVKYPIAFLRVTLLKVNVKVWTLVIALFMYSQPAALYNLGSGNWLAWANGAAAHYVPSSGRANGQLDSCCS